MHKIVSKFKKIILLLSTVYCLLSTVLVVNAQTAPQFLVSWQAQNYAPDWYNGKISPIYGSRVNISFELIDGGKIADISRTGIRWYLNDKLVKNESNGLGIKNYSFINNIYGEDETEVRISIPDYRGNTLDKIIKIPVKSAEAVLDIKSFNRKLSKGVNQMIVWPFFFNIIDNREVSYNWSANGSGLNNSSSSSSIFNLEINSDVRSGTNIRLQTVVKNIKNAMESASRIIQIEVE